MSKPIDQLADGLEFAGAASQNELIIEPLAAMRRTITWA